MPIISGLEIDRLASGIGYITRYVGEANVPGDIRRLRGQVHDMMRGFGQPVLIKHMYNDLDVINGVAETSPNFDDVYGQTRNWDNLSWGIGLVSVVKADDEWLNPDTGEIVVTEISPGAGYVQAPRYRGFGPGFLTYIVEPDAAEDLFKLDPVGALIKVQQSQSFTSWYPDINDNDLIINVTLDGNWQIESTQERYQAKAVNPVTARGDDRRGRREFGGDRGNTHVVNQQFEMSLIPPNSVLMQVETDR